MVLTPGFVRRASLALVAQYSLEPMLDYRIDHFLQSLGVIDVWKFSAGNLQSQKITEWLPPLRDFEHQQAIGRDSGFHLLDVLSEAADQVVAIVHAIVKKIVDRRLHVGSRLG